MDLWPTATAFEHSSIVLESSHDQWKAHHQRVDLAEVREVTPRVSGQVRRSQCHRTRHSPLRQPTYLMPHRVNTGAPPAFGKIPASWRYWRYRSLRSYISPPCYGCSCRVDRGVAQSSAGSWLFCSSLGLDLLYFSLLRRPCGIGPALNCASYARTFRPLYVPRHLLRCRSIERDVALRSRRFHALRQDSRALRT